jgi:alpha-tubulin suppressor-like RCC1 family protein
MRSLRRRGPAATNGLIAALGLCVFACSEQAGPTTALTTAVSMSIFVSADTLIVGHTVQVTAVPTDAEGIPLVGHTTTYASSNSAIASVSSAGLVTGVTPGTVTITGMADSLSVQATIVILPHGPTLLWSAVSVGEGHTCGVVETGGAYCWGVGGDGSLGIGGPASRNAPAAVTGGLRFVSVSAGESSTCGVTESGSAYCWGDADIGSDSVGASYAPVLVAGGHLFTAVSVGNGLACGLVANGNAYCWGNGADGGLGNGSRNSSVIPVQVAGGLTFATVTVGDDYACGVTTAQIAYCWGTNVNGNLGIGPSLALALVPVPVSGGLLFSALSAAAHAVCGLTLAGDAYCWGYNIQGQLGNGTTASSPVPVPVTGGLKFTAITAGFGETCALTLAGEAYCWGGYGDPLAIPGDGSNVGGTSAPALVGGNLHFISIGAGFLFACGSTADETAYCWGQNNTGVLGDGGNEQVGLLPIKVISP